MNQLFIGVSGINAVDNPGPGVGVARALKEDRELDVKIVGFAYDAMEPGIYLDWLIDKSFLLPYPSGGWNNFIERIRYIKKSFGLDFIIPNLDTELPLYAKYGSEIEKLGIRIFVPDYEQYRLRGKDLLPAVARNINVEIPRTVIVNSHEELSRAVDLIGLPVMVKGAFYKACRAHTSKEAASYFDTIVSEWGYPIVVQQIVAGEEMNVVGCGDGEGVVIGQVGIKKMGITSLGKIWTGVTIKNDDMLNAAERFVSTYRWKGPFELECIVDGKTVYLIEINPRFPAWSYFATGVGFNLPANMVRKACGMPLTIPEDYEAGKLFIRYTYEIVTDMKMFQEIITKGESRFEGKV